MKLKLGQRNLVYSMVLAGIMLLFLVGYFMCMLPSLYVDYTMEQNLKAIRKQHETYVEQGTYEEVSVKNAVYCFSVKLPREGNHFFITGKAFSAEIVVRDEQLKQLFEQGRSMLQYSRERKGETEENIVPDSEVEEVVDKLKEILEEKVVLPVDIRFLYVQDIEEDFGAGTIKIHPYSEHMMIIETGVESGGNKYTNYIAMEQTQDSLILSFLPVVTPEMNEIRPIVLQSLPMLGAVILLLVLLFSQAYSKGIVSPIVELVQHAEQMKVTTDFSVPPLSEKWSKREDEVGQLADTLDDFYLQIKESYRKLEEKNKELEEENRRQEIFLRASSHQLKTPIAAALLLVDGMINEIGKYKDTKVYLPGVKEQLLSMRKMVEDILYLNHCAENIRFRNIAVGKLLQEKLHAYQVVISDKRLTVEVSGNTEMEVSTDESMITQILDNLLSNAVKYTPEKERIEIMMSDLKSGMEEGCGEQADCKIQIENFGVKVPEDLLPHIFDPFVSGNHDAKITGMHSHGLGLYISSYYAKKLGAAITVRNGENSVITTLCFGKTFTEST